jgi:retinol-binding protein 3
LISLAFIPRQDHWFHFLRCHWLKFWVPLNRPQNLAFLLWANRRALIPSAVDIEGFMASSSGSSRKNAKFVLRGILLLFVGVGSVMALPRIPNTPAGHALQTLLGAFNSGDRVRLEKYRKTVGPGFVNGLISIREGTGGFDLLSIERSEPLHIWFLVKERYSATRTVGDLGVRNGTPPTIDFLWFSALPPGSSPVIVTLDSALRQRVIDSVAVDLAKFYVHPTVASQMIAALRAHEKAGAYRDLSDGFQFAYRLTSDLYAVSHDRHLGIRFQPFKAPAPAPPTARQLARMREQMESENCGFEKVEVLPGDIGYLKFNAFMSLAVCADTIEAAMAFVAHTRALIFDLRDNHGGDPGTVAFIASYLFDRPTHLNDIRSPHQMTMQGWTVPSLPGQRMSTQPVFVLTSHRTFSAAEGFSYALKNLKRATIVGETTGGGAHPVNGYIVADYFLVQIPIAESISPITHTNWEGTGVLPDVKVPAGDALNVAEALATKDIQAAAAHGRPTEAQERPRTAPSPGTEANLRRQIAGWERGRPDYDDMGPGLQEATLQQRARIQRMFARLGALTSLSFVRVGRDGSDVYDARFAHGRLQWNIEPLSADGRTNGVFFRRLALTHKDVRSPPSP